MTRFRRRKILVFPRYQLRFAGWLILGAALVSVLSAGLVYGVGRTLLEAELYTPHLRHARSGEFLWPTVVWLNVALAVGIVAFAVGVTAFFTRRTAGSLDRFLGHLGQIAQGAPLAQVAFRRRDPVQPTAEAFNSMVDRLDRPIANAHAAVEAADGDLATWLEGTDESAAGADEVLESVRRHLDAAGRELEWYGPC